MQIGNTKVKFHWSVLVLAALLIYQNIQLFTDPIKGVIVGGILTVTLYAIIFIHEMAHIKMAEHLGYRTPNKVTLWALGGMAEIVSLKNMKPLNEFFVAIAGPASNFLMALTTMLVGFLMGVDFMRGYFFANVSSGDLLYLPIILNVFFWYNLGIGIFNMIPAFPMDGGRIFRAIFAMFMNRVMATKIAVYVSWGCSALGTFAGFYYGDFILIAICGFITLVSHAELEMVTSKKATL